MEKDNIRTVAPTSRVCSGAPEPASQSQTVLSFEADASSLPSGEKATALTPEPCPSSVCISALQSIWTSGNLCIQRGTQCSKCFLTILFTGAKTGSLQHIWRGACSTADRPYNANRFISWINAYKLGQSLV